MSEEEWMPKAAEQDDKSEEEALPQAEESTTTKTTRKKRKRKRGSERPPPPSHMIPESLIDYVLSKLQEGDEKEVGETLLQLARLFREQSALCLQQAERLDRMAIDQERSEEPKFITNVSGESLSTRLSRQNVVSFVGKSADIMIQCQETLDSIESRLVPRGQKIDESQKSQKKQGLSAYNLFGLEKFKSIASRLGTNEVKLVSSEMAKAWRSLPEEDKEVYRKRMREINKERAKANEEVDAKQAADGTHKSEA